LGFYPQVTRVTVLLVASLGLLAVWRLTMRLVGVPVVAFWTMALIAIYPIWFVQSTLAHADIFAAACTLWGLVYALPERDRNPWAAALWFTAAALCKETAIAIPLTLAVVSLAAGLRVGAVQALARGGLVIELYPAAGRLVRLALHQDRLPLRQSRVSAL
jgi:hypothetical protein